jgi:hypothetical protein
MLLEVTLERDNSELGKRGDKILINDSYIVAIKKGDDGNAILFVDLSDLATFNEVYIRETYKSWHMLKLNV